MLQRPNCLNGMIIVDMIGCEGWERLGRTHSWATQVLVSSQVLSAHSMAAFGTALNQRGSGIIG